jgi:hypothetical protein
VCVVNDLDAAYIKVVRTVVAIRYVVKNDHGDETSATHELQFPKSLQLQSHRIWVGHENSN